MSVDKAVESGELQRVINGMDIAGIHPSLKLLCDAARSYVRMVEEGPDYEAAMRVLRDARPQWTMSLMPPYPTT